MSLAAAAQNACQRDGFGPWRLLRAGVPEQNSAGAACLAAPAPLRFVHLRRDCSIMLQGARRRSIRIAPAFEKKAEADIEEAHRS
jgi:hypothetical protein